MSSFSDFLGSVQAVFSGVVLGAGPPQGYRYASVGRQRLASSIQSVNDSTGWRAAVENVNYQLDRRGCDLNEHSAEKLAENVRRVASGDRTISQAHASEAATFLQDRNAQNNSYGSCMAGLMMHSTMAVLNRQIEQAHPNVDPSSGAGQ